MLVSGSRRLELKLGVMQGRLIPSRGRGIQFFPFEEWEKEFGLAAKLGLDAIEFIFDLERSAENPLMSSEGRARIRELIGEHNVLVRHICADFFMRQTPFVGDRAQRKENEKVLRELIQAALEIGASSVEIPLLEKSSLRTEADEKKFIDFLRTGLDFAHQSEVQLSLETDLPPRKLLALVETISHPALALTYDSGNSASLGYDSYEEITVLGEYISNVHIKDRILGGGTVPLGGGHANFERLFRGLGEIGYRGSFTLQAARGEEGKEKETIAEYISFVSGYIERYLV
ncbi:MAG: sugar phosphate isomerase/epimerase [Candidatus Sungiibacteriota bacterium]|uniref:Sugar phosphate isomerase/epimerase n=1 Tax=Candidatus Sungiibacteriota bacterium TaxID=2750080 RepID=A0A7T5RJP9_9BACT|nr:MAG: sugar phosphate isomerase/epimerase [Candidatus Sungbacteria bacterium]